ncbi:Ribosomal protein L35 [Dillenia turbinata]|uniref:Ribosomal protein L35 n=1 Tax=Dillenia turbinata TaxID=194707 RepID=A0AAN8VVJ0_9MAGN
MQRWCAKLRCLPLSTKTLTPKSSFSPAPLLLHSSPSPLLLHRQSHSASLIRSTFKTLFNAPLIPQPTPSLSPLSFYQVRHFSAKSKEKKWKRLTPATSKVKKIKMKFYSSYKSRFRTLNDGTIRRWREGKRHNAHLKSKKAKRRLRRPALVPAAYAKVMKKLSFCC